MTMKKSTFFRSGGDAIHGTFSQAKIPLSWLSIPTVIPHRLRRKIRSRLRNRTSPASSLSSLNWSFSPKDTIRALRAHRWSYYDGQYLLLAVVFVFSLSLMEHPGPLLKTLGAAALMTALVIPITRQFFLPALPILAWVILFFSCRSVAPPSSSLCT